MEGSWPADDTLAGLVSKLALSGAQAAGSPTLARPPGLGPPLAMPSAASTPSEGLDRLLADIPRSTSAGNLSSLGSGPAAAAAPSAAAAAAPAAAPTSLGWGGQAIPDTAHFKAPWFGKNRARGGGAGGRGRSGGRGARGAPAAGAARRGGLRRPWLSSDGSGAEGEEGLEVGLSVDAVLAMVSGTPRGERIGKEVYQALFQLDSRAAALLLKDLAKAGLLFRCGALCLLLRAGLGPAGVG